jgi:hypothetical protein
MPGPAPENDCSQEQGSRRVGLHRRADIRVLDVDVDVDVDVEDCARVAS